MGDLIEGYTEAERRALNNKASSVQELHKVPQGLFVARIPDLGERGAEAREAHTTLQDMLNKAEQTLQRVQNAYPDLYHHLWAEYFGVETTFDLTSPQWRHLLLEERCGPLLKRNLILGYRLSAATRQAFYNLAEAGHVPEAVYYVSTYNTATQRALLKMVRRFEKNGLYEGDPMQQVRRVPRTRERGFWGMMAAATSFVRQRINASVQLEWHPKQRVLGLPLPKALHVKAEISLPQTVLLENKRAHVTWTPLPQYVALEAPAAATSPAAETANAKATTAKPTRKPRKKAAPRTAVKPATPPAPTTAGQAELPLTPPAADT